MKHTFFIASFAFFIVACQKDDNNNNNNTTTGSTHSCGAKDVHNPNLTYGTVKDVDGNSYKTIQIGNQTWMAENLKTTKYRNGTSIPNVTDNTQWQNNTTGAFCSYENNTSNDCPYGKLYNWYAVNNTNKLCPTGWHVSTDADWTTLTDYLGGGSGGKMKSLQYWGSPNESATNSSGFSGLPGGLRYSVGAFLGIGNSGDWWSSTEASITNAWSRNLGYNFSNVNATGYDKNFGFSVRCIKD